LIACGQQLQHAAEGWKQKQKHGNEQIDREYRAYRVQGRSTHRVQYSTCLFVISCDAILGRWACACMVSGPTATIISLIQWRKGNGPCTRPCKLKLHHIVRRTENRLPFAVCCPTGLFRVGIHMYCIYMHVYSGNTCEMACGSNLQATGLQGHSDGLTDGAWLFTNLVGMKGSIPMARQAGRQAGRQ
jgi:hypothetical protein